MIALRDYQQELCDKVIEAFRQGKRRPLVVAPCGAGKSYNFAWMAERTKGDVLILTHRRELKDQHDLLLHNLGLDHNRVRVGMVMTEVNHLRAKPPKLLILDEAHLARSNSWMNVVNHYNTHSVGFTATPTRLSGEPLGDVFDSMVQGVTAKWLIQNHYLAPYDYYAPVSVDASGLATRCGDYIASDLERLMMDRAIYSDVIDSYKRFANGLRSICYCVSVKHAETVSELFREAGYRSAPISASTHPKQRTEIMEAFRCGDIDVLCNVGIISEGVSVDECMACLLLRPTQSLALYHQQAMRCMRYLPGKRAVILDFVGNYTRNPMPDADIEWSLTESTKPLRNVTDSGDFAIRTCPSCFRVFEAASVCPYCGETYPLHPREIKAHEEIELQRISDAEREAAEIARKTARMMQGMARTFPDLVKLGKERGYARPEFWAQMILRGRKK